MKLWTIQQVKQLKNTTNPTGINVGLGSKNIWCTKNFTEGDLKINFKYTWSAYRRQRFSKSNYQVEKQFILEMVL